MGARWAQRETTEAAVPGGLHVGSGISRVLSDDRLAQRAATGDKRAFAAIFDRYHQKLYRYCLAIVGNPEDAQDALQNAMVKVLGALPGEERRIQLRPWLYRIANNESIELLRRRRETRQLDPELGAAGSGLVEEAEAREQLRRLVSDLGELPERQRGAVVMRELAGLGFAEIGTALGTSPAVARQALYEARLGLRQMDQGREASCETVTKALSDGDGRVTRRRDLRAHLRACGSCRRFGEEIESRERDLAALSPLPAIAAAGLLQGLLGGTAKSLGVSAALKGAVSVAVVAAIGVTAADRGGLIHAGLPGEGRSQATKAERAGGAGSGGTQPTSSDSAAIDARAGSTRGAESAGHLGASRAAKPGVGNATSAGGAKANAEAPAAAPPPQDDSVAAPQGKGYEKQLPSAAAHGQQTAASHKAAEHGSAGTQSHPAHPPKPAHPTHPAKPDHPAHPTHPAKPAQPAPPTDSSKPAHPAHPSKPSPEKGPPSPPSSQPESHADGTAAPPDAGAEEAPLEDKAGKKPKAPRG